MYRRLRDLREDLDIFQSEIADFLHVHSLLIQKLNEVTEKFLYLS